MIVLEYTPVCDYATADPPPDPRREPGPDQSRAARGRSARVRRAGVCRVQRGGDRGGRELHPRRVLLQLRVEGTAVRGAAPGARLRALPRDDRPERRGRTEV